MIAVVTPYMSRETYNKIKESVLNKDAETFVKLIVDFYDKLTQTNSNWIMPSYIQIDDHWTYTEKELYKYNPSLEPKTLHLERDIWVKDLNGHAYFSTKHSKEMIYESKHLYSYKGRVFELYCYKGTPRFKELKFPNESDITKIEG